MGILALKTFAVTIGVHDHTLTALKQMTKVSIFVHVATTAIYIATFLLCHKFI